MDIITLITLGGGRDLTVMVGDITITGVLTITEGLITEAFMLD